MIVTVGAVFFAAIAMAAVSVVRHRAPMAAAPPPPAPNPLVPIAPPMVVASEVPFAPPSFPQATLDLAAARRDVGITIYSAVWCGYCKKAKEYMTAHDMKFVERDVEDSEANAVAMRKISPKGTIPAFDVEGETWVGWSSANLESAVERAAKRRLAKK
ncbi:MAG: glutaredoxin family protein [Polyangiales bacterium]